MKFHLVLLLAFGTVYFTSCQKVVDWRVDPDTGNVSGDTTTHSSDSLGSLLVKVVAVSGAETITTNYTYNSARQLVSEYHLGTSGGMPIDTYKAYYRDSVGRIFKIAQMVKQAALPVDTSFTYVYYDDPETKNFYYTTMDVGIQGFTTRDSSVYTYDGNGNLALQSSYMSSPLLGNAPALTTKWEYTYTNGNLVEQKVYSAQGAITELSLTGTCKYTYDNRTNPMILDGEAFLTGRVESASKNNITTMEIIDASSSANNFTVSTAITYGASNKPATGIATLQPGDKVTRYTFYYR